MHRTLQILSQEIAVSCHGLSERELTFHAHQEQWCVAQVLEHLQRTYSGTVKGCERVLQQNQALISPLSFKLRMAQWYVFGLRRIPKGRKAAKTLEPTGTIAATELPRTIQEHLAAMDARLEECERRFGKGRFMNHPELGALTAEQWRIFHLVHGRHHLKHIYERAAEAKNSLKI